MSVIGLLHTASVHTLSVVCCAVGGSSLSVRSFVRCGSTVSARNEVLLASSFSVRALQRLGSGLSVGGSGLSDRTSGV